jgi:RNA polymerase sigma factor (sigma-70 family)
LGAPGSSEKIVSAFLEGRAEAVRTVRGWVEPVCRHQAWGGVDAEEMVQESMLRITDALRRGSFERRSSFKTFACAVAKVTCLETRRFARRQAAAAASNPGGHAASDERQRSPEGALLNRERLSMLSFVVQGVSPECRRLWQLVFGSDLTPSEIASRLEVSPGTVRVRLHRCLKRARELVEGSWLGPWLRSGWETGR